MVSIMYLLIQPLAAKRNKPMIWFQCLVCERSRTRSYATFRCY